jgi:hypothetical protein
MAEWWQGGSFIGRIAASPVTHWDHDERLVKIRTGREEVPAVL